MRSSSAGVGLDPLLEALVRRADPQHRQALWALAVTAEDQLITRADFEDADSTVGFDVLDDGVRLEDTTTVLVQNLTGGANLTDLSRLTPIYSALVDWSGTQPAELELDRVQLYLNPRVNSAQPRQVARWRLECYALRDGFEPIRGVAAVDGTPTGVWFTYQLLAPAIDVAVTGDAAGFVTFDFASVNARPRPKQGPGVTNLQGAMQPFASPTTTGVILLGGHYTIVAVYALAADGSAAGNVALEYDAGAASVSSGGNVLRGRRWVEVASPPYPGLAGRWQDTGSAGGTPRMKIEIGSYADADLEFTAVGNRLTLEGGTPTNDVVFTILGAVPLGTTLTGQVLKDGGTPAVDADWRTFISGQKSTELADVSKRDTYEVRARLTTNVAGTLTPTLRELSVRAVTTTDLSDVARLELVGGWGVNAVTCQGEVTRAVIHAARDDLLTDYRDRITDLLVATDLADLRFRVGVAADALSEEHWLWQDVFIPEGQQPNAADFAIACLSNLVLLRSEVPKYSPGGVSAPDGDASVGAWTTDAGGGANLYQRIDEADADDVDFIRSEVDPAASAYEATLPTPADPVGRRHYVDYRYLKDTAAGKTIDLTVQLRQGTTVIAFQSHADIGATANDGSFVLTDAQAASITDYTNLRVRFIATVGGAGGSRRAYVTWAQFRLGGRREAVEYSNQGLKDVYDDLLQNQLELDPAILGPGVEDDTTLVAKVLSSARDGDEPIGKDEVDAIAYLAGMGLITRQGRITAVDMFGPRPVAALFPLGSYQLEVCGPGIEDRIEEFFVSWGWNTADQRFEDEVRALSAAGLLAFGPAKLDPPERLPEHIARWINTQTLAETVAERTVRTFGPGKPPCRWTSNYEYPELEPGDVVALEQDQFAAKDPHTGRAIRGRRWLLVRLELVEDVEGTRFQGFFTYADILTEPEAALRLGLGPVVTAVIDDVIGHPESARVRLLTGLIPAPTIYWQYLDLDAVVPAQDPLTWTAYTGSLLLQRDQSVSKKLAVFADDRGLRSRTQVFEIGRDKTPAIINLTLVQRANANPTQVDATVSVDPDVRKVAFYRRDNAASGFYPTTGTHGPTDPLDPQYLTKECAVAPDGLGRFKDGTACIGGGTAHLPAAISDDAVVTQGGAVPTYATNRYVTTIAVPLDYDGNTGARAAAQVQVAATLPAKLDAFTTAKTADGIDCFPDGAEITVSWTPNASVANGSHDLYIYRELMGVSGRTLVKIEASPATTTSFVDDTLETWVVAGGPLFTYRYTYELQPNGGGTPIDVGQATPDINFEGDGSCPV